MVVADETHSLQITGNGDVLEPHDGIIGARGRRLLRDACVLGLTCVAASCAAIGSGGPYALAAARALIDVPGMDAMAIGAAPRRDATHAVAAP
jgi:ATP-dependent HslUV protease subunit HslV